MSDLCIGLANIFCLYFEDHTLDKTTCYEVLLLNHLPVKVLESKLLLNNFCVPENHFLNSQSFYQLSILMYN